SSVAHSSPERFSRIVHRIRREPDLALGVVILAVVLLIVLFPGLFTRQSPTTVDVQSAMEAPSALHLFGTDDVGRDVFARVFHGARITLSICASSLIAAALIGGSLGLISGFLGGRIDMLLGRLIDVILSFPPIILGVMVTGILGPKTINLVFAL